MPETFCKFVIARRHDDTAWGDVARDVSADPDVEESWGYVKLRRHVELSRAVPVVIRILEEMHEAYLAGLQRARVPEGGC